MTDRQTDHAARHVAQARLGPAGPQPVYAGQLSYYLAARHYGDIVTALREGHYCESQRGSSSLT